MPNTDTPKEKGKSQDDVTATRASAVQLSVHDLTVRYGDHRVLERLSLDVAAGSTLIVLGESGCGKTTLLRALAGLIEISTGTIGLGEMEITRLPPAQRGVLYLDQEPLLFEHLTVAENLGFALELQHVPRAEIKVQVERMLGALDLPTHARKREWQLSGGQRQRVAFGRAILARPRLLLLDEPFGSLDGKTRGQMQTLFAQLCVEYQLTTLFVTHDVKEALVLGQAYARMEGGVLKRYASRDEFLRDPATGIPAEIEFWRARASEGNSSC